MFELIAYALFQLFSITGAPAQDATSFDGGSGGWGTGVVANGGSGGWGTGVVASKGGSGGWGTGVVANGGSGGWGTGIVAPTGN